MLSKNLLALLKRRDMTLAELARKSGISKSTLSGISSGAGDSIRLSHLKKLAEALDVSVYELAYGEQDPRSPAHDEVLHDLFRGDVRVILQRIERKK